MACIGRVVRDVEAKCLLIGEIRAAVFSSMRFRRANKLHVTAPTHFHRACAPRAHAVAPKS